jgi:beta-glucosidase
MKKTVAFLLYIVIASQICWGQEMNIISVSASTNTGTTANIFDNNLETAWIIPARELKTDQWLLVVFHTPGDIKEVYIESDNLSTKEVREVLQLFITFDPMNMGNPVEYTVKGDNGRLTISFPPKYGAYLKINFTGNILKKNLSVKEIRILSTGDVINAGNIQPTSKAYMDPSLPLEERVESLLSVMTTTDKMELLREGWGIPGIPHLGIPDIKKVEAIHGFSYGSGATIFPQSIGLGATWNVKLVEEVAMTIGDETVSANAIQAWSPVLDVAQDPRWGRCEETYGEDPVLVSFIGGAWIKGYQSKGLLTTPKHFGGHGAPLGGRDSHDIGLSEREFREIHLSPFRDIIKKYDCQSIMMAYSDYQGIPVAKSKELLKGILRDEWGFDGFIVSDCGAIGNLTARKHYTATDKIEAAKQALAAGIATNCGDTYNDKEVIAAAVRGEIDMDDIDFTCRTLLRTMFRNGLFENNPSKALDWNKVYPGWNSPEHREVALRAARESIVLLKNKDHILPLSKQLKSIAVIGPAADDLQPGDYTGKPFEGQLKSVLTGIREALGTGTKVIYEKGCDFFHTKNSQIEKAVNVALQAEVVVLVLGDCSNSESSRDMVKTSGENHDLATLILPGDQQKLLEAVCATGKPVILVLQAGRPYNLSFAADQCNGILVNWLPGQEGGYATADVLFGDYNPAGRLPMTFPRHVGQVPLYYNFKTSGRRYEYSDLEYYPLYPFGFGLSYTTFHYSDLNVDVRENGDLFIQATVSNTGKIAGDEVVQLYITDMYASVKTRIMELKGFERIHLQPGETKTVSFTITPYEISLLNDQMDRVVEKGEYKIMIGGTSPSYEAKDQIKNSVGYKESRSGVNGKIDYTESFAADFKIEIINVEKNIIDKTKIATLLVKNVGSLTDTGEIFMYIDHELVGDPRHFELDPGQEKYIRFKIKKDDYKDLQFVTKYKTVGLVR